MSARQVASLDVLRGIAILLVIAAHFGGGSVEQQVLLGNAGVILFFFLSGFLMDKTLSEEANPVSYATRRAFRILPMYWCSLLLVIAFGANWAPGQLLANATFSAPLFGAHRMLGVYWTLYIEVMFYCLAPFLMLAGNRAIQLSTYIALVPFIAFTLTYGVGSGAPFYTIFCLCGMQIGSSYRKATSAKNVAFSVLAVAISASAFMPISIFLGLIPIACACALFFCLHNNFRFWPLEFVGQISYSWYLLHSIFGYNFAAPVGIAVTFAASVLTHYTIEKPLIRLGKRFITPAPQIKVA